MKCCKGLAFIAGLCYYSRIANEKSRPGPVEGRAGRGVKQLKRKYTLRFDQIKNHWALKHDATDKTIKIFKSKEDSTRAGVLRKALGKLGGTVIIRTKTGTLDEERNFPEQS